MRDGTLLKAALQTIVDNHVQCSVDLGATPDIAAVHRGIIENSLYGLDVVPFAIHLAAAALAIQEPDVQFENMNLSTVPIGGSSDRLGSLDLLTSDKISIQANLFGPATAATRVTGKGDVAHKLTVPPLDLCVMNPPFTRSVGGNFLFGHLPEAQRVRLQAALRGIVAKRGVPANITAGLGSVFVAVGHQLLKPLPRSRSYLGRFPLPMLGANVASGHGALKVPSRRSLASGMARG